MSISNQATLSNQNLSKTPTELQNVERSVFLKKLSAQNLWSVKLGSQEGIIVPIWIIVGFQQRVRKDSQKVNNGSFFRPPVTSAHCIFETGRYPDFSILLNYDDDDYSQGFGKNKEAFKAVTKDDNLKPY